MGRICHFHIPGDATRREYAVYVMVAKHRQTGEIHLYVGKTGDNREGCNPVISRAGNHFSFNKIHSQMRNRLPNAEDYDFDFFSTNFGEYVDPSHSRDGIDIINEMERQLNRKVQEAFGEEVLLNPVSTAPHRLRRVRNEREALATEGRRKQLDELVTRVRQHVSC